MLTAIGWTILDLLTCFELPYRRTEERFAIVELATIDTAEGAWSVQTQNLSLSGALIRLDAAAELEAGQSLTVRIAWVPPLPAKIIRILGDKQIAVAFAPLSDSRRTALIRRVFLGPEPKPDPINVRGLSILGGVARRLTRSEF